MYRRVLMAGVLLILVGCASMFIRVDIASWTMLAAVVAALLIAWPALKDISFSTRAAEPALASPFPPQPASIHDPGLGFAAIFLLGGGISGVASGAGVFLLDEKLDQFNWSPPIAYSIALVILLAVAMRRFSLAHSVAVVITVFVAWTAAFETALSLDRAVIDSIELTLILSGMLGAAIMALPFSFTLATPKGARPVIALIVAGGAGVLPLALRIVLDDIGIAQPDGPTGLFVLFVCWQAVVAATIGYYMRASVRSGSAST